LTSRLFDRPVSIAIKGVSSGGKSFTVEQVLKFFPPSAYFVRTGMSERAIIFSDEDFRYRHLVVYEAAGMNSDMQSYLIRTLLSEGKVAYEVVEKTKSGLRPRVIEKQGPTGLITTTTAPKLHPENETRLLSLSVIDTPDQTRAVMQALAAADANETVDYGPWQALQAWLATGERRVVVPFAAMLANSIPPIAVRLRRDFKLLLTLIQGHALLHRETRSRDDQGRIVATVADYKAVRDLVAKVFAEGIEATVPATVRETVEAVATCVAEGVVGDRNADHNNTSEVSLTVLAKKLGLDKSPTHHRVRKAIDRGFLVNREEKRGMAARIALADPLPDEIEILPDPGVLRCCGVDGGANKAESDGDDDGDAMEFDGSLLPLENTPNTTTPTRTAPGDYEFKAPQPVPDPVDCRCDHCGTLGATGRWDWPGRPDSIWLHRHCEEPWFDKESAGRIK
jgi:hypothetical protein